MTDLHAAIAYVRSLAEQYTGEARGHILAVCNAAEATSKSDAHRAFEEAMGPRKNPLHPMFRDHNCAWCGSGERPCKQGNPSQCEYPHARND